MWRAPTKNDLDGEGDHRYLVDIMPGDISHQATNDGDALIRVGKRGWYWTIFDLQRSRKKGETPWLLMEEADTREEAIGAALSALAKLRS